MFEGRLAAVTGASGGLGAAICLALAKAGARVIACDLTIDRARAAVETLDRHGVRGSVPVEINVADYNSVKRSFEQIDAEGDLDILVNNAGIREIKSILDLSPEEWDRVLAVNLSGPFYCSREAAVRMRGRGGAIVNIASVAGLVGIRNRPAYCSSKHGVIGLTRNLAFDLAAHGIRVNAVCPGAIPTPMTAAYYQDEHFLAGLEHSVALGNAGTPQAIADAVVYLCSPAASFVTGVALPVDGGFVAEKSFAGAEATSFTSAANSTFG